jgi:type III secretion system YscD/HrpQ family protein
MAAKLVAEEGIQKGLVLSLDEGSEWVIGRDPDACQLLIEDPSASRKHLLCRKTPDGFFLQNLSSTNPASVNDEEVQEPRLLRNGDLVKIGTGLYRFYEEDEAQLLDKGEVSQVTKNEGPNGDDKIVPQEIHGIEKPSPQVEEKANASEEPPIEEEGEYSEEQASSHKENQGDQQPLEKPQESPQEEEIANKPIDNPPEPEKQEEQQKNEQNEPMKEESEASVIEELDEKIVPSQESENEPSEPQESAHKPDELEELDEHISIFEEPSDKSNFPEINFDLTETGRWLLKVVGGPNHGAEFIMQPASTYIIGTDPNSCDIVFHDTSVSRQHAKITVNDDDTILLEDLKSRNGTFVDGKPLTGKQAIPTNILVMMGTSSFVVYDREGEMHTIISPLLPSIVKVLQEESKTEKAASDASAEFHEGDEKPDEALAPAAPSELPKKKEHAHDALGAFILIAIITGLFVIIGIGTTTLFKSQPVVTQQVIHPDRDLTQALSTFPNIKYSFNRSTGRLLLVGHVLTASDKNQMMYNLQGMNYIRSIDDSGVIIDEGVWREINQVLNQNPNWKSISIHSPTPGHFVISGYLKSRKQAEQLWEYISTNFPYLDLLEKRVIVEEDVVGAINSELQNHGFKDISVQMNEGDVVLAGNIPAGKMPDFDKEMGKLREIPGVRSIKNVVAEQAPEQSMVNISDRYEITGVSHQGGVNTSVIINGRILSRGDILDGMTITSIKPNAVFLEKEGIKYRIDYSNK